MDITMGKLCGVIGVIGAFFSSLFGGWNSSLSTLCILMALDFVTGLVLSLLFCKSSKTTDGAFESVAGFKGLAKKFMIVVIVFVAHRIDLSLGVNYLRDGVAIAFTVNEALSIIENAGQMGVPVPDVLMNGISVLKGNAEKTTTTTGNAEE